MSARLRPHGSVSAGTDGCTRRTGKVRGPVPRCLPSSPLVMSGSVLVRGKPHRRCAMYRGRNLRLPSLCVGVRAQPNVQKRPRPPLGQPFPNAPAPGPVVDVNSVRRIESSHLRRRINLRTCYQAFPRNPAPRFVDVNSRRRPGVHIYKTRGRRVPVSWDYARALSPVLET